MSLLLVAILGLGGCTDHGEDRSVERVLKEARRAVLAGDGARACRLLTHNGRRRALAFGAGLARPPGSCKDVVRMRWALAQRDPESSWPEDLREATFEVLSVDGRRARAEMRVEDLFGTASRWRIQLRRTRAGWRVDDSTALRALASASRKARSLLQPRSRARAMAAGSATAIAAASRASAP
jgi:hypothetical protein